MNPMVTEALGAILRWALAIAAGVIVQHGIWTPEDASKYVTAASLALLTLCWSLWQKYANRLVLLTALASPKAMSEHEALADVGFGLSPSVTTPKDEIPR